MVMKRDKFSLVFGEIYFNYLPGSRNPVTWCISEQCYATTKEATSQKLFTKKRFTDCNNINLLIHEIQLKSSFLSEVIKIPKTAIPRKLLADKTV
jgi:hypothetical protein